VELKKLTPILTVEAIEPSLPFWVDALGFTKTVDVPHEGSSASPSWSGRA
jgi:hypothetical protein